MVFEYFEIRHSNSGFNFFSFFPLTSIVMILIFNFEMITSLPRESRFLIDIDKFYLILLEACATCNGTQHYLLSSLPLCSWCSPVLPFSFEKSRLAVVFIRLPHTRNQSRMFLLEGDRTCGVPEKDQYMYSAGTLLCFTQSFTYTAVCASRLLQIWLWYNTQNNWVLISVWYCPSIDCEFLGAAELSHCYWNQSNRVPKCNQVGLQLWECWKRWPLWHKLVASAYITNLENFSRLGNSLSKKWNA